MQTATRLSAAQRETIARQDAPFLAAGLMPGNARSFEAHLRQAAGLMRDRQKVTSPCARLVRHVGDLFERSIPGSARARLACGGGCALCCYQPVRVSPPELFFLAPVIAERPELVAAVRKAAARPENPRADAPGIFWIRCPLLDPANHCSSYAARPLACRSYVSLDLNDCRTAYFQPGRNIVRSPVPYSDIQSSCRLILQAALKLNGLSNTHYELNAALCTVLDTQDAEKRWLRGENILAELSEFSPNEPEIEQLLAQIIERVGPTL